MPRWQLNRTVLCWEGRTWGCVWNKAEVGMEMVFFVGFLFIRGVFLLAGRHRGNGGTKGLQSTHFGWFLFPSARHEKLPAG